MTKTKPNLFKFATSELSHDAFIAWLLAWSDPQFKNEELNEFSVSVLKTFFALSETNIDTIQKVEVKRQYRNIDVLILVTDQNGNKWALVVENKIHTSEHTDQLNRYREKINRDDKLYDITSDKIIGIYYKMWEQSNLKEVIDSGFTHFDRNAMIDLLNNYTVGTNDIVDDYKKYIQRIQANLEAYKTKRVYDWNRDQWIGFYSKLKEDIGDGDFGYVANPSGGFMGFWFGSQKIREEDSLYIQSEEDKLCFKIHINEKKNRQNAKWFWHQTVIETGKELGLRIVKPKVMRIGKWFTIGVLKSNDDEPWMILKESGILDYERTLARSLKAINVVEKSAEVPPDYLD